MQRRGVATSASASVQARLLLRMALVGVLTFGLGSLLGVFGLPALKAHAAAAPHAISFGTPHMANEYP